MDRHESGLSLPCCWGRSISPMPRQQKITFGEMRAAGARGVTVFCTDHKCSHSVTLDADCWPDSLRLSDVEERFVCRACGKRGADIRPIYPSARDGQ
jgi:hypothetical protein